MTGLPPEGVKWAADVLCESMNAAIPSEDLRDLAEAVVMAYFNASPGIHVVKDSQVAYRTEEELSSILRHRGLSRPFVEYVMECFVKGMDDVAALSATDTERAGE